MHVHQHHILHLRPIPVIIVIWRVPPVRVFESDDARDGDYSARYQY